MIGTEEYQKKFGANPRNSNETESSRAAALELIELEAEVLKGQFQSFTLRLEEYFVSI